jgi:hypothetical protein
MPKRDAKQGEDKITAGEVGAQNVFGGIYD